MYFTDEELSKYKLSQLKVLASYLGIEGEYKRAELIEKIKDKLGKPKDEEVPRSIRVQRIYEINKEK